VTKILSHYSSGETEKITKCLIRIHGKQVKFKPGSPKDHLEGRGINGRIRMDQREIGLGGE
jgi:hypothetical protein